MDDTSPETTNCPACGAALDPDATAGLCPRCLMGKAMEPTGGGESSIEIPSLENVAEAFPDLEVLQLIGRGGMGAVYKARQKSLDRFVALKLLPQSLAEDPQFPARFEKEAKALAALGHTNIVTVHDFGQAGGFYFLLMEFVDGPNLRELIRARKLTADEAFAIVPPLCEALQFAHDRGIVHRDIKPENLLLHADGRIKIADFGIAKIVGEGANVDENPSGTPAYMAPEQSEAPAAVDGRSDIYSLGVVIYEMLTGEQPGADLKPPSSKVAIDVRIDEVVLRALDREPEQRWQTAADLKTQIDTLATPAASSPRTESDYWRITCLTCGNSKTVTEAGGVRIGARSTGKRILARCSTCDAMRRAIVHRANATPPTPEQAARGKISVLGFWALFCTLLGGLVSVVSVRVMDPSASSPLLFLVQTLPVALVGLGLSLGAIWLSKLRGRGASGAAWSAMLTVASLIFPFAMMYGMLNLEFRAMHTAADAWHFFIKLTMGLALPMASIGCILGWRHLARSRHETPPCRGVIAAGFGALFWPLIIAGVCTIAATIALLDDVTSIDTSLALGLIAAPLVCMGMIRCTVHWVRNEEGEQDLPRSPWRVLCAIALIVAGVIVAFSWSEEVKRQQNSSSRQYRIAKQEFQRQILHHEAAKDRAEARLKKVGLLTQDNLFEIEEETEQAKATADNALHLVAIQIERLEDGRDSPTSMQIAKLIPICVGIGIAIAGSILLRRPRHVR